MSWNDYAFVTGADGVLDRSTPADVRRIVTSITGADHAVLHLHGGLVSEPNAKGTAEALAPVYLENGKAHPAFIIYRTGFLEILKGHLWQIARESFYQSVLGKVLKWARGKLGAGVGAKSIGLADLPRDLDVLRRIDSDQLAAAFGIGKRTNQRHDAAVFEFPRLAELNFVSPNGPGLFGNKDELLAEWRRKLALVPAQSPDE